MLISIFGLWIFTLKNIKTLDPFFGWATERVEPPVSSNVSARYSEEALEACVKLASQYVQDRYLPDKAIDVMDETGARVQLRQNADIPQEAWEAKKELREMEAKKEDAVRAQNYEAQLCYL